MNERRWRMRRKKITPKLIIRIDLKVGLPKISEEYPEDVVMT